MHLGRAAQRVRVLDAGALEGLPVTRHDPAAVEHRPEVGCRDGLAGVRAQGLQVLGEDRVGPELGLDAHGRGDVGDAEQTAEVGDRENQLAEHAVGAVDEGEALLLGELHRLDAVGAKGVRGGVEIAVTVADMTLTHEGQGAVRQGCEVTGAAEGSVLEDEWGQALVEYRGVGAGRLEAHTGPPGGQRREAQQHQRPDDLTFHLRP